MDSTFHLDQSFPEIHDRPTVPIPPVFLIVGMTAILGFIGLVILVVGMLY